ncbi:MAG: flagellar motor protein [Longimicrobiaceae bacterium]
MVSSSFYLKNAAAGLLIAVPLVLAVVVLAAVDRARDQPPLIVLSEADGYTFASGQAEISADFARQLDEIVADRIRAEAIACACSVVEVIGHTDGQLVNTRSNLDRALGRAVFSGATLSAGSNADLGLMRAWAVVDRLRRHPATRDLRYYGYSAAQMIQPSGQYASPDDMSDHAERRRIEIRLRR